MERYSEDTTISESELRFDKGVCHLTIAKNHRIFVVKPPNYYERPIYAILGNPDVNRAVLNENRNISGHLSAPIFFLPRTFEALQLFNGDKRFRQGIDNFVFKSTEAEYEERFKLDGIFPEYWLFSRQIKRVLSLLLKREDPPDFYFR